MIPALGSLMIAMIKNSAIVGASLVALPDLLKQTREVAAPKPFQFDEVFFWGAVGYLLLTVAATLGLSLPRAIASRFGDEAPMSYLFDPDNWEWLWTGNNFRFLLEGFSINLEIAAIGIVLSLVLGLLLALMRISRLRLISVPAGIWVDVWRNLPLILTILYLALAVPGSWRDAYEDAIPGWFPEALHSGLVLGALLALVALQLGGPLRDHALGHPVARPRTARGRRRRSG